MNRLGRGEHMRRRKCCVEVLKNRHAARYRLASSIFRFVAFDLPVPGYSLAEDFAKRVMEG